MLEVLKDSPIPSSPNSQISSSTSGDLPTPTPLGNIPTEAEWHALWAAWDLVTLPMIPPAMLHQKPIDLRHKCLFYIGHIPT